MFKLRCVAALGIAERRVRIHNAQVTEVFECYQVLALVQTVQPPPAESQRREVLVNHTQQLFGPVVKCGGVCCLPGCLSAHA